VTKSAIVLFGSNIEPHTNFLLAMQELRREEDMQVRQVSDVFRSGAVTALGEIDPMRPVFHNAAILIETTLEGRELRQALRRIEEKLGRQRSEDKFEDRTVDLDILGYRVGDFLEQADPTIRKHAFAAIPVAEVAPDLHLPDGETLADLAEAFKSANTKIRSRK
jgi:2-amino-4-hydroxy-6-hydroxymethyldihydropteridine diphosphokinase